MTFFLAVYQWDSILPGVGRTFDLKIGGLTRRYTWAQWVMAIAIADMTKVQAAYMLSILNM
jgi:hypothetical protein